jgi:hypothetical protein
VSRTRIQKHFENEGKTTFIPKGDIKTLKRGHPASYYPLISQERRAHENINAKVTK